MHAYGYLAPPKDKDAPALAVGVWMGNSDNAPNDGNLSLDSSAPLWSAILTRCQQGHADRQVQGARRPRDGDRRRVHRPQARPVHDARPSRSCSSRAPSRPRARDQPGRRSRSTRRAACSGRRAASGRRSREGFFDLAEVGVELPGLAEGRPQLGRPRGQGRPACAGTSKGTRTAYFYNGGVPPVRAVVGRAVRADEEVPARAAAGAAARLRSRSLGVRRARAVPPEDRPARRRPPDRRPDAADARLRARRSSPRRRPRRARPAAPTAPADGPPAWRAHRVAQRPGPEAVDDRSPVPRPGQRGVVEVASSASSASSTRAPRRSSDDATLRARSSRSAAAFDVGRRRSARPRPLAPRRRAERGHEVVDVDRDPHPAGLERRPPAAPLERGDPALPAAGPAARPLADLPRRSRLGRRRRSAAVLVGAGRRSTIASARATAASRPAR